MKTKILGSILGCVIAISSYAKVSAFVDKTHFYSGDSVRLTISASGENITLPNLTKIGSYPVLGVSNSKSISIINGRQSAQLSKIYTFKPSESFTIPSFEIDNSGVKEQTQPIPLKKIAPHASKNGDDIVLSIQANKKNFFVGEKGKLQVVFKIKKSLGDIGSVNISPATASGIEFITDSRFKQSADNIYNIWTTSYSFTLNNFGELTIPSVSATISKSSGFGLFQTKRVVNKVFSNPLTISVTPLPDNLTIFGDFKISLDVDKNVVDAEKPVNAVLKISGTGNIENIEKFNIIIKDATIYSDEPQIEEHQFVQKFAIVSDKDFVIPSVVLEFFDKKTHSKKIITTQRIPIKVQGALQNSVNTPAKNTIHSSPKVKNIKQQSNAKSEISKDYLQQLRQPRDNNSNHSSSNVLLIAFVAFIVGALFIIVIIWLTNLFAGKTNNPHKNLITRIKLTQSDKSLFALLTPLNITELKEIMQKLEENIYKNTAHKGLKKEIIKILNKV